MNKRLKKKLAKCDYQKRWYRKRLAKKKTIKRNKWLIKRYPFLLPRNRWSGEVGEYYYEFTELDSVPDGWRKSFGYSLLEELRDDLLKFDYLDKYRILQIKEKFGGLRWYAGSIPVESKAYEIASKYERMSENVCMTCGKPATMCCIGGWFETICPECWEKRQNQRYWKQYHRREYIPYEEIKCEEDE